MYPEDLLEEYPDECEALGFDESFLQTATHSDLTVYVNMCDNARRFHSLEKRVVELEDQLFELLKEKKC